MYERCITLLDNRSFWDAVFCPFADTIGLPLFSSFIILLLSISIYNKTERIEPGVILALGWLNLFVVSAEFENMFYIVVLIITLAVAYYKVVRE